MNVLRVLVATLFAMQLVACASLQTSAGRGAQVKVMAASAIAPALKKITPQFERDTGHKLTIEYGILPDLKKKIDAGDSFDLAIIPDGLMKSATKQGRVVADTQASVARVGMGVAVKAGASKPDISSVDAFKRTLLNAKSVAYPPEGLIGVHLTKVFGTLGISDQMNPKVKALQTVELVPPAVSAGEAELGFAPSTLLVAGSGIDYVGPLPAELQSYVVLVTAVGTGAKEPDAARALIRYLATPESLNAMKTRGYEVASR